MNICELKWWISSRDETLEVNPPRVNSLSLAKRSLAGVEVLNDSVTELISRVFASGLFPPDLRVC
jgi:hypothetical protein